jgi:rhodanese-related sulfurtransferase
MLGLTLWTAGAQALPQTPDEAMNELYHNDKNLVPTISASDLENKIKAHEKVTLIDVREPAENQEFALANSKLIPLGTLADHVADVPKNGPVYVYCRSGARSARAVAFLRSRGYTNVISLGGGMLAWQEMMRAQGETKACKQNMSC